MQGIYTHIPETNYVPKEYSVAAILLFLFMVVISLVSVFNLLYFYISTFRSIIIIIIIIIINVLPCKMLEETKSENVDTNLDRFVLQDTSWFVQCGEK
jgi:hypothetical protein